MSGEGQFTDLRLAIVGEIREWRIWSKSVANVMQSADQQLLALNPRTQD
jgi:hypothetical protein